MKALILAPFSSDVLAEMRERMEVVYESWTETLRLHDPGELGLRLKDERVDVLVVEADFLFDELFERAESLAFVGVCRGSLHQVDLEAATERGVVVVHTPGRNARAVAELTLGLILALARHLPQAHSYVQAGAWRDPVQPYITMQGWELHGKVVGIVGLGTTGQRVARLTSALGMQVVACDPYAGPTGTRVGRATLVSLQELLASSDVVSVHVPDGPETVHMIGRPELEQMKQGACLVNAGSARTVDQDALAWALDQGHLGGAALDVHTTHPIPQSSPLLGMDRVILTPHLGGATHETVGRHSHMVWNDLQRFMSGRRPRRLADPDVWRQRRGL